jgi:carbon-monoxide dehydrogenase small subunit
MKHAISINVNGVDHSNEVESRLLLVHYLRDLLGLTGTHVGCETSICGACTILVDGQAVKSCTMFAVRADGCNVDHRRSRRQRQSASGAGRFLGEAWFAMRILHAGMIIAASQIIDRNPHPSQDEIRHGRAICAVAPAINISTKQSNTAAKKASA